MTPDLDQLGRRHKRLQDDLDAVRTELAPAIREARAEGATYAELMIRSGYKSIETIRQIIEPKTRTEINDRRRKPKPSGD